MRPFLLLLTTFSLNTLFSQELTETYTLDYINERLSDQCSVEIDDGYLAANFYRNGDLVRQDYVYTADVVPEEVRYSESERAIILTCFSKAGDCVDRNIIVNGIRKGYNRVNLPTECKGDGCIALENAIKHLLYLYVLDDYVRTEPFETKQ